MKKNENLCLCNLGESFKGAPPKAEPTIDYKELWRRLGYRLIGLAKAYKKQEEQQNTLFASAAVYRVMDMMDELENNVMSGGKKDGDID
jgi:hypothetical protein